MLNLLHKRHKWYLLVAGATLLLLVILKLLNVDFQNEINDTSSQISWLPILLIAILILLSGLLVYVSLKDYSRRSLLKVRISSTNTQLTLKIANVSGTRQIFDSYLLEIMPSAGKRKMIIKFPFMETVKISDDKQWSVNLDFHHMLNEQNIHQPLKWIRLILVDKKGINYFSNKLRIR